MFGCAVFHAFEPSLIEQEKLLNMKIAAKALEARLVALSQQESIRALKTVLQTIAKELKEGIYYLDPEGRKLYISEELATFLQADTHLSSEDFEYRINDDVR